MTSLIKALLINLISFGQARLQSGGAGEPLEVVQLAEVALALLLEHLEVAEMLVPDESISVVLEDPSFHRLRPRFFFQKKNLKNLTFPFSSFKNRISF